MKNNHLLKPLQHLIDTTPKLRIALRADIKKTNKQLVRYAKQLSKNVNDLTLLDLCDEQWNLLPELLISVQERPRTKKATDKTHICYSREIISRLRRIVSLCGSVQAKHIELGNELPDVLDSVPEFMKPILVYLPRVRPYHINNPERLNTPLTRYGLLALRALLSITEKFKVNSLNDIFVTQWDKLEIELTTMCRSGEIENILYLLKNLRSKVGYKPMPKPSLLKLEEFPTRLRDQFEIFQTKAPSGAATDPELCRLARDKKVTLNPLEESTLDNYFRSLATLLAHIPHKKDIDITDLIRLESEIVIEDGEEKIRYFNPLVDAFRQEQRRQKTLFKNVGFDSSRFSISLAAIRAVAAYNGIFRYHQKFSEAYVTNEDIMSREFLKALKKKTYPMVWIDYNLSCLQPKFDSIISNQSFKTDITDLRLCMCYIYANQ